MPLNGHVIEVLRIFSLPCLGWPLGIYLLGYPKRVVDQYG